MNDQEIAKHIKELETEMRDIMGEMDSLHGVREYNPGSPIVVGPFTDLIRLSILRKRMEIAEFDHANLRTMAETGKRPDHFDSRITELHKEIEKDEAELKLFD